MVISVLRVMVVLCAIKGRILVVIRLRNLGLRLTILRFVVTLLRLTLGATRRLRMKRIVMRLRP